MVKILSLLFSLLLSSCGSSEIVKSKSVCKVVKHVQDDLYQLRIDDKPVNDRWYLEKDARELKVILGVRNKCRR